MTDRTQKTLDDFRTAAEALRRLTDEATESPDAALRFALATIGGEWTPASGSVSDRCRQACDELARLSRISVDGLSTLPARLTAVRRAAVQSGHPCPAGSLISPRDFASVIRFEAEPRNAITAAEFASLPSDHPARKHFRPEDLAVPPGPVQILAGPALENRETSALVIFPPPAPNQTVFELVAVLDATRYWSKRWDQERARQTAVVEEARQREQEKRQANPMERIRELERRLAERSAAESHAGRQELTPT